jgi:hypothetical protein
MTPSIDGKLLLVVDDFEVFRGHGSRPIAKSTLSKIAPRHKQVGTKAIIIAIHFIIFPSFAGLYFDLSKTIAHQPKAAADARHAITKNMNENNALLIISRPFLERNG